MTLIFFLNTNRIHYCYVFKRRNFYQIQILKISYDTTPQNKKKKTYCQQIKSSIPTQKLLKLFKKMLCLYILFIKNSCKYFKNH